MTWLLWFALAVNSAVYVYVGRAYISKPRHEHPVLFWNPHVARLAVGLPPSMFVAITVAGFVLTDSGWWLLIVSALVYVGFSVRPNPGI